MKKQVIALDTNQMEWIERPSEETGKSYFRKTLIEDEDTGMLIKLAYYPEGYITPWHDHPCAHGMYVLEGTLYTSDGEFGPGTFVWHPEGVVQEHGATAPGGVKVLFITNKQFGIRFVPPEER